MSKNEPKIVQLPTAAMDNMSGTAKGQLADHAPHIVTSPPPPPAPTGDPGVFLENGVRGPGWYHYGTSADQNFIGHDNAPDYYIFDWGVKPDGSFNFQGNDTIDKYEANLDGFWDTGVLIYQDAGYLGGISYDWVYDTGLPGLDPGSSGKIEQWMTNLSVYPDANHTERLAPAGSLEWLHIV